MSITLTINELSKEALDLRSSIDPEMSSTTFSGVEFDSRKVEKGNLFVALPGNETHGNHFIAEAFKRGATVAIAEESAPLPSDDRVLIVPSTLKAFWSIASYWRKSLSHKILAITGSSGKTTCKELCAKILCSTGEGVATEKSFNNHVGVPYSLCQASRGDSWQVIEIGMNHRNEILPLSRLTAPDVAMITMIGPAHIGNLGSLEEIAKEKLDICSGLSAKGKLILNGDDELLLRVFDRDYRAQYRGEVYYFGSKKNADIRIVKVEHGMKGMTVLLDLFGTECRIETKLFGSHHATNIAGAALSAYLMSPTLGVEQLSQALADISSPPGRGCLEVLQMQYGALTLFDDSYNSNPASLKAFFDVVGPLSYEFKDSVIAVGDMAELGEFSEEKHIEAAKQLSAYPFKKIVLVGEFAPRMEAILGADRCLCFSKVDEAISTCLSLEPAFFAAKASRSVGLDLLCKAFRSTQV